MIEHQHQRQHQHQHQHQQRGPGNGFQKIESFFSDIFGCAGVCNIVGNKTSDPIGVESDRSYAALRPIISVPNEYDYDYDYDSYNFHPPGNHNFTKTSSIIRNAFDENQAQQQQQTQTQEHQKLHQQYQDNLRNYYPSKQEPQEESVDPMIACDYDDDDDDEDIVKNNADASLLNETATTHPDTSYFDDSLACSPISVNTSSTAIHEGVLRIPTATLDTTASNNNNNNNAATTRNRNRIPLQPLRVQALQEPPPGLRTNASLPESQLQLQRQIQSQRKQQQPPQPNMVPTETVVGIWPPVVPKQRPIGSADQRQLSQQLQVHQEQIHQRLLQQQQQQQQQAQQQAPPKEEEQDPSLVFPIRPPAIRRLTLDDAMSMSMGHSSSPSPLQSPNHQKSTSTPTNTPTATKANDKMLASTRNNNTTTGIVLPPIPDSVCRSRSLDFLFSSSQRRQKYKQYHHNGNSNSHSHSSVHSRSTVNQQQYPWRPDHPPLHGYLNSNDGHHHSRLQSQHQLQSQTHGHRSRGTGKSNEEHKRTRQQLLEMLSDLNETYDTL